MADLPRTRSSPMSLRSQEAAATLAVPLHLTALLSRMLPSRMYVDRTFVVQDVRFPFYVVRDHSPFSLTGHQRILTPPEIGLFWSP